MTKLVLFTLALCLCTLHLTNSLATATTNYEFNEPLYLEVYIKSCKLVVYRVVGTELEQINELSVATVKDGYSLYPKGRGYITEVILNPTWKPTKETVKSANKKSQAAGKGDTFKVGQIFKAGDPRNAMGTFKMLLSHNVPGRGQIYRIHGTNRPDQLGKQVSRGCVRADNQKGYALAKNIKARLKLKQLTAVNIIEA